MANDYNASMEPTYYIREHLVDIGNETGVYLFKDRIADLKFTEQAQCFMGKNILVEIREGNRLIRITKEIGSLLM